MAIAGGTEAFITDLAIASLANMQALSRNTELPPERSAALSTRSAMGLCTAKVRHARYWKRRKAHLLAARISTRKCLAARSRPMPTTLLLPPRDGRGAAQPFLAPEVHRDDA